MFGNFSVITQGVPTASLKNFRTLEEAEARAKALSARLQHGRYYRYAVAEYAPNRGYAPKFVAHHGVWHRGEKVQ